MQRRAWVSVLCVVFAAIAHEASSSPVIKAFSGGTTGGSRVVITGNGFGELGPTIVLYDEFTGTPGSAVPLNGAIVGTWTGYPPSGGPKYSAIAHSLPTSMMAADGVASHYQIIKDFPNDVSEFYISYWIKIPEGTCFPGATAPGVFSNGSSWKFAWIMYGPYGYTGENDMMIPAYTGQGIIQIGSNDYTPNVVFGTNWWSWTNWMRLSLWMKANEYQPTSNGVYYWQALNETVGLWQNLITTKPVFDVDYISIPKKLWNRITLPGWIKNFDTATPFLNVMPLYDDFYLAIGPGSSARVEIGDSATYTTCKRLLLVLATTWSDACISAQLPQNSALSWDTLYIYVTDMNGNTNTNGFPVLKGGTDTFPTQVTLIGNN